MQTRTSGGMAGWLELGGEADAAAQTRLAAMAYRHARAELDEALRHGWLEFWYQPKFDLRRASMVGAEALARIRHPELGVLLPKSFIPNASEDSLGGLTEFALRATLRDWSVFEAIGCSLHLSLNLPASVLLRLPIAAAVAQYRPKDEHWPGLILEVTDSDVVRELAPMQEAAAELRLHGISIAVDDFGSRHDLYSNLHKLPFAELKIASGFVKNCSSDASNAALCRDAIDLAHRFGSAAVAKGIESRADLQALQHMGCDFGQGVVLAPPMPVDGLIALLRQRRDVYGGATASGNDKSGRSAQAAVDRTA
jgi:EAL domain-containing protein (putative c-di-GMP-specific phosphodiesterase class I)